MKLPLETHDDLKTELRLAARLDHPHILPIKNADVYDGRLVIAYPLGAESLADRLTRRLALDTCLDMFGQLLDALAYAHGRKVIHCDVKPENLILFPGPRLRLADFGIAKVARRRTLSASGAGTVGYVAPEQALGKPSFRSDVFAAGLVFYRMLSGQLPEWPFEWPLPGHAIVRRKIGKEGVAFVRRALALDHRKRYRDAQHMRNAFKKIRRTPRPASNGELERPDWSDVRQRAFLKKHRGVFRLTGACRRCAGPVSEEMQACPWCGSKRLRLKTALPATCGRCGRGRKLDWPSCAWCYGPSFDDVADRSYADKRYTARCSHCRGDLMPFMRYCPWCRRKVRRAWRLAETPDRCGRCGCGVFADYWTHCPWCTSEL